MSDDPNAMTAASLGVVDDPSIPVLTERIVLPADRSDRAQAGAASPAAPAEADDTGRHEVVEPAGPLAETVVEGTVEVHISSATGVSPELVAAAESGAVHARQAEALFAVQPESAPTPVKGDVAAEVTIPVVGADDALAAVNRARTEALRAAVLQRVSEQLPERVDAAVRVLMQPAIEQATAQIAGQAQAALSLTLHDLVTQALREELARASEGPPQ